MRNGLNSFGINIFLLTLDNISYGGNSFPSLKDKNGNVYYDIFSYLNYDEENAQLCFDIYGQYQILSGTLFLEENSTIGKSSLFKVYGDGNILYEYNAVNFTQDHSYENFTVDVAGVRELTIELSGEYVSMAQGWLKSPVLGVSGLTLSK